MASSWSKTPALLPAKPQLDSSAARVPILPVLGSRATRCRRDAAWASAAVPPALRRLAHDVDGRLVRGMVEAGRNRALNDAP